MQCGLSIVSIMNYSHQQRTSELQISHAAISQNLKFHPHCQTHCNYEILTFEEIHLNKGYKNVFAFGKHISKLIMS